MRWSPFIKILKLNTYRETEILKENINILYRRVPCIKKGSLIQRYRQLLPCLQDDIIYLIKGGTWILFFIVIPESIKYWWIKFDKRHMSARMRNLVSPICPFIGEMFSDRKR